MKKYIILIASVFMFASCSNQPNKKGEYVVKPGKNTKELHIKYSDDGNISYIQEYNNGKPEGMQLNYGKENIKNLSFIKDQKNNGCGMVFHLNGTLNNFGTYVDGAKTGWFYVFDNSEMLTGKREYIKVDGNEFLNQWIQYNADGSVNRAESNYIKVTPKSDTVKQGDEFVMNISLEAAFFKQYMIVVIGPYDANYALPKGAKCDTLRAMNFVATYKTKDYKKGKNIIRGMVEDLQPDAKNPKIINDRKIYFTHEFRVQ